MHMDAFFSRLFKDILGPASGSASGSLKLKNITRLQFYGSLFRLIGWEALLSLPTCHITYAAYIQCSDSSTACIYLILEGDPQI